MAEFSPKAETGAQVRLPEGPRRADLLLSLVHQVWPRRAARRDIAGLPPSVVELLREGRPVRRLARAAAALDRALPGWVEVAASTVAAAQRPLGTELQQLCALLAHRPLGQPGPVLRALESSEAEARLWLLVALMGTDTPAVRSGWLRSLREGIAEQDARADRTTWLAFLRCFLGGWLTWADFRDCLECGRALAGQGEDDYRPALDRLGLWSHPTFTKWYRQLIYEVAHQPGTCFSWEAGGWIRDFPGEDYLWDALDQLKQKPDSWWPLHVVRWVSAVEGDDERLADRLRGLPPIVLCLVSLVRHDLAVPAGRALAAPAHASVVHWLKASPPHAPLDMAWVERLLEPWVAAAGDPMTLAAGALCSIEPPPDFIGPESHALRSRAFLRQCLVPEFDRVMDNLFYVHALRQMHLPLIREQAERGRPTAVRALALWPEQAAEAAPLLLRLSRAGSKVIRDAAQQSLETLRQRTGITDLGRLEKRVDLASAWSDAGLEGRGARVWWDVRGYHIRLSVARGKVALHVYAGSRRLASLPAVVRSAPEYEDIRQARAELAKSYRYFRLRFEQVMVEGLHYSGRDFAVLLANPVVRSVASRLVLSVDGEPRQLALEDADDDERPAEALADAKQVIIPHPLHLLQSGALDHWQEQVINGRIGQPFKQVFREVYLLGDEERAADACSRFAGYPLVARRAFALLRGRGYSPRRGDALKEWPGEGLLAHIEWAGPDEGAGRKLAEPGSIEPVTSGAVWWESAGGGRIRLAQVPGILLSETLRDADLLVSRAGAGELGFSSEETRRLRATLVRYLARALGLTSVYVGDDSPHVIVEGQRAMYRVHLGSGSVLLERSRRSLDLTWARLLPTESLVAESMDSLTARIIGLIVALSHDDAITDPRFLAQLA